MADDSNLGADGGPLAGRLTSALHAHADGIPVDTDAAWARFSAAGREQRPIAPQTTPTLPHQPPAFGPVSSRWRTWRTPLIAAASVAVLAVGISAIATGGFGWRAATVASGTGGDGASGSGPVTVPVDTTPALALVAGGSTEAAPASSVLTPAPTAAEGEDVPVVTMSFVDGAPPAAGLRGEFQFGGSDGPRAGGENGSDGSPLGYVTHSGGIPGPRQVDYLWGVVGPEVGQVQVVVTIPPPVATALSSATGSATWFVGAAGVGTDTRDLPYHSAEAATTWTDMPYGYHAFVLQLPTGSSAAAITAIDPSGSRTVQTLNLNLISGAREDLTPQPPGSAAPVPEATTGVTAEPTASAGVPAASSPAASNPAASDPAASGPAASGGSAGLAKSGLAPIDVTAGCLSQQGDSISVSDSGFDLGTIKARADGGVLCFFDGRSWWSAQLTDASATGPLRAAAITAEGPMGSQIASTPPTTGRFVFGVARPGVDVAIRISGTDGATPAADPAGGTVRPVIGPAGSAADGIFVIAVPEAVEITLVTVDSAGVTVDGTTFPATIDGRDPVGLAPSANGAGGTYLATYPDPTAGMDALVTGRVRVLNGCVAVVDSGPDAWRDAVAPVIPIFPESTVARATSGPGLQWRGQAYADGDSISLTGGFAGVAVPARCGSNTYLVSPVA